MTRAEHDAELKRSFLAFVDHMVKVLDRFPGARAAVATELERLDRLAAEATHRRLPDRRR